MIHLSIPVRSISDTLFFYSEVLGCKASRISEDRIDFDFFQHHLVAQLSPEEAAHQSVYIGTAPNRYPLRHFGIVVDLDKYKILLGQMEKHAIEFAMPPQTIFQGTPREQDVFLVFDPSGNAIEFKGIHQQLAVFSKE
jgi:extradiol dioxygenase family protein